MRRWLPFCLVALGLVLCVVIPMPKPLLMKGGSAKDFAVHRLMIIRLGIGAIMIVVGVIWLFLRVLNKPS